MIDLENRTADLAFSSEEPVERWGGYEVLDHNPESVDLERMKNGGALLADHNWTDQIGVIESIWIDQQSRKGRARVRFSKSQRGQEMFQDVIDNIRTGVSVGYEVLEAKQEEAQRDGLDVYRVTRWRPLEISLVSVPADFKGSGVGRCLAPAKMGLTCRDSGADYYATPAVDIQVLKKEKQVMTTNTAILQERARVESLRNAGDQFNAVDLADNMIRNGGSVEDLHKLILERRGNKKVIASRHEDIPSGHTGMSDRDVKDFSFARLYEAAKTGKKNKELEICEAAAQGVGDIIYKGRSTKQIVLPYEVLSDKNFIHGGQGNKRKVISQDINMTQSRAAFLAENGISRAISASDPASAKMLISTNLMSGSFVEVLQNELVLNAMGATVLAGLVGNVAIPRETKSTEAYWVAAEGDDVRQTDAKFDQVIMTPSMIGAYVDVTAQAMLQSEIDLEIFFRASLASSLARGIDKAAIYGAVAKDAQNQDVKLFDGITNTTGIATHEYNGALTYADVVDHEFGWSESNSLNTNTGFAVSPSVRRDFRKAQKFPGTASAETIWEPKNRILERPAISTNQMELGHMLSGNWDDVILGLWGSVRLLVDPYTLGRSGGQRFIAHTWADVKTRRPDSFTFSYPKASA